MMQRLDVSVPDPMKLWIDGQSQSGRYSDAGEYIRDLVRRDQERSSKIASMQRLVDEGLASGISSETMDDIRVSSNMSSR